MPIDSLAYTDESARWPYEKPLGATGEEKDIRFGWIVVILFFGIFLGFASFARLDAAAYADGTVSVSGSRQAVQHRDGGTVAALHVKDGDHVQQGQILIQLAGAEVVANERALAAQVIGLQAARARLAAELAGAGTFAPPAAFAALGGNDRILANTAMRLQSDTLSSKRRAIAAQKRVLGQQTAQLRERISGFGEQMTQTERQGALFDDQLAGMQTMVKKGYASINRLRELERARASVSSDRANLASSRAAAREQIGERQMQSMTLDSQNLRDVADELEKNDEALGNALPKWLAARRQVELTQVRAPATGRVVALNVFTIGGVIQPGQKMLEIVPDAAPLVVQMMVNPNDADDIQVGQTAEIRFVTLHERDLPVFTGKITRLSADSLTDERTGARYFTGEVRVAATDLSEISRIKATGGGIKAGLPAQVLIPLRRRTLLQYLFEPLFQSLWRSGHEH